MQKDFVDQGGTVKPRDRFAGGTNKRLKQTTGSIKALDPVTGEIKAVARTDLPNWSGVLATARQSRLHRPVGRRAGRL